MSKTDRLHIRCTTSEKARILAAAQTEDMTVSELLRVAIMRRVKRIENASKRKPRAEHD